MFFSEKPVGVEFIISPHVSSIYFYIYIFSNWFHMEIAGVPNYEQDKWCSEEEIMEKSYENNCEGWNVVVDHEVVDLHQFADCCSIRKPCTVRGAFVFYLTMNKKLIFEFFHDFHFSKTSHDDVRIINAIQSIMHLVLQITFYTLYSLRTFVVFVWDF